MQHAWVQPYMIRHLQPPAPGPGASLGPSRLRNSVSHTSGDMAGTPRDLTPTSSSTNGLLGPLQQQHTSMSASGMVSGGTSSGVSVGMGIGGRLFMPVPAPPASISGSAGPVASSAAQQSTAESGPYKQAQPHPHPYSHPQSHAPPTPQQQQPLQQQPQQSASSTSAALPAGSHRPQPLSPSLALKTSVSLHEKPSQESQDTTIIGVAADGGRIHESISDPSARVFEMTSPHPPGVLSSASLFSGAIGGGGGGAGSNSGAGSRGGAGTGRTDMDRTISHSQSMASGLSVNGSGPVRPSQYLAVRSCGRGVEQWSHITIWGVTGYTLTPCCGEASGLVGISALLCSRGTDRRVVHHEQDMLSWSKCFLVRAVSTSQI